MRPKKRILLVDGNEKALSIRRFTFETRGYLVKVACTGSEALDVLAESPACSFELMISELLIPGMDGTELVRRGKLIDPELRTLLISSSLDFDLRGHAADVFLHKGHCSAAEIFERVRVLVARKRGPKKSVVPAIARMGSPAEALLCQ